MSNLVSIAQLAQEVNNALSSHDAGKKWEENSIKSLLALGECLSSVSGITNDKVVKYLNSQGSGKFILTKKESLKLSAIFETVNSNYRDKVGEDDNLKLPVYQYLFSPIKLALCAFEISEVSSEDNEAIDQLSDGLSQSIDTYTTRAEKLNQAKQGIDELVEYSQSFLEAMTPTSTRIFDPSLSRQKSDAVRSIETSFKPTAFDYIRGNDKAFDNFQIKDDNQQAIETLSKNRQTANIVASILLSLTVIGCVIGVGQYLATGNYLFCRSKPKSHSNEIFDTGITENFPNRSM